MTPESISPEEISALLDAIDVTLLPTDVNELETTQLGLITTEMLDQFAVDFGGLADPVGQFQAWISGVISDFSSWIVSSVSGLIEGFYNNVVSVIQGIVDQIVQSFQTFVVQPIEDFVNDVVNLLTQTLPNAIQNLISQLSDLFSPVMDLIGQVLEGIQNIPNTIQSVLSQMVENIQNALATVPTTIQNIVNQIVEGIQGIPTIIQNIFSQIQNMLSPITNLINQIISGLKNVPSVIQGMVNQIIEGIQNIPNTIQSMIGSLQETFGELGSRIQEFLGGILEGIKGIPDTIGSILSKMEEAIKGTWEKILGYLGEVGDKIQDFASSLANLPEYLQKGIEDLQAWIWAHLPDWVKKFLEEAPKALGQVGTAVMGFINAILKFPEWFPVWFKQHIADPITQALSSIGQWIWENIPDWIKGGIGAIQDFFGWVREGLEEFIRDPKGWFQTNVVDPISQTLSSIGQWIWEHLPDWVKGGIEAIQNFFDWVKGGLQEFIEDPRGWFQTNIIDPVASFIGDAVEMVRGGWSWLTTKFAEGWDRFVSGVKTLVDWIGKFKDNVVAAFTDWFKGVQKWFNEESGIPQFLQSGWDWLQSAFQENLLPLFEKLADIVTHPEKIGDALRDLGKWLWDGLKWLWDTYISPALNFLYEKISWLVGMIGQGASAFGKAIMGLTENIIKGVESFSVEAIKKLSDWVVGTFKGMIIEPIKGVWSKIYGQLSKSLAGISAPPSGEWGYIVTTNLGLVGALVGTRIVAGLLGQIANLIPNDFEITLGIIGHPDLKFSFKPAWFLKEMSKVLFQEPRKIVEWLIQYQVYWFAEQYVRPINAIFRDIYPVMLPSVPEIIMSMRRSMATDQASQLMDFYKHFLALYGYSTPVVDFLTARVFRENGRIVAEPIRFVKDYGALATEDFGTLLTEKLPVGAAKPYIEYTDRFGNERVLPLSMIYDIPSESVLASFMVRDIFLKFEDFKKIMLAKGVFEDTSYLYYLARFRYPPPERLWDFFVRAEAGMLWYKPPPDVRRDAEERARDVGAFLPTAPADMNILGSPNATRIANTILSAISTYMRWHDFAPFSWIKDFTADAWIWLDLMADIPGRIDARWMYRWRTFSALADELGYANIPAGVDPDEYGLAQVVIARGMHPRFVPVVAVSEMMNALTEERTLFRTGVMYSFRYNALTPDLLKEIFAGMFSLKFNAPVWNPETNTYSFKQFEVPVRFLEGEAKLMGLRAIYDRANIMYRALDRTVIMLLSENYDSPEKYTSIMKGLTDKISEVMKEVAKKLGVEEGFAYQFDEALGELLKTNVRMRNAYYTLRRLRYWLRWSLYQLWSRFMRGYVSEEELNEFIDLLVDRLKLTEAEREFFHDIGMAMRDVYRREFMADAVLMRLKKGEIKKDEALKQLKELGIDEETAEAMIQAKVKNYVPTVSTLATLAEYVPEALKLMDKVFDVQGIPEEEREIWKKYLAVKPVKDEVSKLVTEVVYDYAKGVISDKQFNEFLNNIKQFGYTDEELDMIKQLAELRKARYQLTPTEAEYIPTISTLTTVAEHVPEAMQLMDKVFKKEGVSPQDRAIWEKYVKVRPVTDEIDRLVTEVITAYASGVIDDKQFDEYMNKAKEYGYTDEEIEILKEVAKLRRLRYAE